MSDLRPPARARRAVSDLAAILAGVAIICIGIVLATARGWVGLTWADAWSLVAWVVIIATLVAGVISWREASV